MLGNVALSNIEFKKSASRKVFSNIYDLSVFLGIKDIKPEFVFFNEQIITYEDVDSSYDEKQIPYPESIQTLFEKRIPEIRRDAIQNGRTFDNNPSYQLRGVAVERPFDEHHTTRKRKYILKMFPTDYEHFVYPNSRLSEEVYDDRIDSKVELRKLCDLDKDAIRFDNLEEKPFHFKVGTGLAFITNDGYLISTVRSNRQLIVPGDEKSIRLHLSTAEGMLKGDLIKEKPNPFYTAYRSLDDELGLKMEEDIRISDIKSTGFYLDTMRAQPFFSFILKHGNLTAEDVFDRWKRSPKDKHENKYVLALEFSPENISKLFKGCEFGSINYLVPDIDADDFNKNYLSKPFVLASNHAEIGYLSAHC